LSSYKRKEGEKNRASSRDLKLNEYQRRSLKQQHPAAVKIYVVVYHYNLGKSQVTKEMKGKRTEHRALIQQIHAHSTLSKLRMVTSGPSQTTPTASP
jgi:hypothetical protein